MKVLVGTKNPVKIEAVKDAFTKFFPSFEVISKDAHPDRLAQPFDDEVFKGAYDRACALSKGDIADYYVGIEGGIITLYNTSFLTSVVCIINNDGKIGFGIGPCVSMPQSFVDEMHSGIELGIIADRLSGKYNMKQQGGITEILTKGVTQRKDPTTQAVLRALVPFVNKELYFQ